MKPLLDLLKFRVKIESASFFERCLQLQGRYRGWDPATGDGLDDCRPHIGPEKGRRDMAIVNLEERCGKGLELFGWRRKIHNLRNGTLATWNLPQKKTGDPDSLVGEI